MGNVVAIAHENQVLAGRSPSASLDRQHIGHRLAGMAQIGQSVDHGHRIETCQLLGALMRFRTTDDGVDKLAETWVKSDGDSRFPQPTSSPRNRLEPPSWAIPVSKLTRVRKLGFSNSRASTWRSKTAGRSPAAKRFFEQHRGRQDAPQICGRNIEQTQ